MGTRKHAVVTGASSGIGRATVLELSARGYHVFGTVRCEADALALRARGGEAVTPLLADVTDEDQVAAVAARVAETVGPSGLDVLVNNAGQGKFQPLEVLPAAKFRAHLAVNTEAPLRVTQALLPLLRRGRGRIVFIGSVSGRLVLPFSGAHSATKAALAAVADALRLELAAWGIKVILVEPGAVRTAAVDKMEADTTAVLDEIGPAGRALYGAAFTQMMATSLRTLRKGSTADDVARVVVRAVRAPRPRARYLVGSSAWLPAMLATLPAAVVDAATRRMFRLPGPGSLATVPGVTGERVSS
jgi:NAD(P)-dependent dehydrogenase (short-subunit alcohol dehydrogenase family)